MSIDTIGRRNGQDWHIIATGRLVGLDSYLCRKAPPRIFSGVKTYYYIFESEEQALQLIGVGPDGYYAPKYAKEDHEIIAELTSAVQSHLDATAQERNYDNILSLCTYASSDNPKFRAEGLAGVAWRDACWAKCYEVLAACRAETRTIPSSEELIAELPKFAWPEG